MIYPKADFENARLAYPGRTAGADTQYQYYITRTLKHLKHKEEDVTPLLLPAIERQIKEREREGFHPHWKDFKSWIYNSYFEHGADGKKPKSVCFLCGGEWSGSFTHPETHKEVRSCYPCKVKTRGY